MVGMEMEMRLVEEIELKRSKGMIGKVVFGFGLIE